MNKERQRKLDARARRLESLHSTTTIAIKTNEETEKKVRPTIVKNEKKQKKDSGSIQKEIKIEKKDVLKKSKGKKKHNSKGAR